MRLKSVFFLFILHSVFFIAYSVTPRTISEYVRIAKQLLVKENGVINTLLFVPDHKVKKSLLGLIYNEQKSIATALFRLTDREVAQALSDAHERGIKIKIIADSGNFWAHNQKVSMLENLGIPIRYYQKPHACMHNKFWIFGQNFGQKPLVWSGSANATYSGLIRNEENVYVTDNPEFIVQYTEKFEALWEQLSPADVSQEGETEKKGAWSANDWHKS